MISISNSKHYYMKLKEYHAKKKDEITIHSSAVEYLAMWQRLVISTA